MNYKRVEFTPAEISEFFNGLGKIPAGDAIPPNFLQDIYGMSGEDALYVVKQYRLHLISLEG